MNEKTINKRLRREFSGVGWALVVYYFILNLLVIGAMAVDALGEMLRSGFGAMPDMTQAADNGWGYLLAIFVGLAVLHAWKGREFWRGEIFAREKPMTLADFVMLLCLVVGVQLVNSLWITLLEAVANAFGGSFLELLEEVSGRTNSVSMFLYSGIFAPVSEEIFFRGYVLRTLKPYGKRFAVVASALLFGLFHGNLLQTPYAFLVGLLLGYAAVEYSIGWAVALHMFNNLVLAELFSRLLTLVPEFFGSLLQLTIIGGAFVAGVVILVQNRRAIRAYIRGEWIDRRVLKCFFTNAGILVLTALMLANVVLFLLNM